MFITLTIDTNRKNKAKVRLHKNKMKAARGWRKTVNIKRRNLWQKIRSWGRGLEKRVYKMGSQTAMF